MIDNRFLPGRYLLGFDTTGSTGTVALARALPSSVHGDPTAEVLAQAELPGRSYSALLVSTIGTLLGELSLTLGQLAALVVVSGPGSFTGVRIGLSIAKGLAEGTGLSILAVSRLAVLAHRSGIDTGLVALDAGRGEYYVGEYRGGECVREALIDGESLAATAADGLQLVVCEAGVAERLASERLDSWTPRLLPPPTAADALAAILPRFWERQFDDPELLDGNYLRSSDAELFAWAKNKVVSLP